jgi:hypothetical protein
LAGATRSYSALLEVSRHDLEAAFFSAVRGGVPQPPRERLRLLSNADHAHVTYRLARRQHECGCTAGAVTMFVAAAVAAVGGSLRGASSPEGALGVVGLCIVFIMVATVVGKLSMISVARAHWRRDRDNVLTELAHSQGADHVMVR